MAIGVSFGELAPMSLGRAGIATHLDGELAGWLWLSDTTGGWHLTQPLADALAWRHKPPAGDKDLERLQARIRRRAGQLRNLGRTEP